MEPITLLDSLVRSVSVAGDALVDALVLFVVMCIAQAFYRSTYFVPSSEKGKSVRLNFNDEVAKKGNFALAISLAGYLVGIAIAATGMLDPDFPWKAGSLLEKAVTMFSIGMVAMVFIRLSLVINDRFILSKFSNPKEISLNNMGVACVEAASCIATGFIVSGALTTKADSVQEQFGYGLAYWLMGQIALVVGTHCYRLICGYDLDGNLERKTLSSCYDPNHKETTIPTNLSSGIAFGGFLVAIGLIVQAALTKAGTAGFSMEDLKRVLLPETVTVLVFVGIGLLLLMLGKLVLNKAIFPVVSPEAGKGNVGAGVLAAAVSICIGFLYASSVWFAALNASATKEPEPQAIVAPAAVVPAEPAKAPEAK